MAGTTGTSQRLATRGDARLETETKHAFKTTAFVAFVVVSLAILIAAMLIKGADPTGGEGSGGTDEFVASQAWLYVAIVTLGYMLSRGLAKSGSREPYWGGGTNEHRDRDLGDNR